MAPKQTGSEATTAKLAWTNSREREATRRMILDAAARILADSGSDAVTFANIATATGLARATLYGHFTSKNEIIEHLRGQVVASPAPAATEEPAGPVIEDVTPQVPAPPADATANYDDLVQEQAKALGDLARRVIVPKSLMKEGTETVLAKLEARVAVVEKSYVDLEKRVQRDLKSLSERSAAAVGDTGLLRKTMDSLDKRQQHVLSELRLEVHKLAHPEAQEEDMGEVVRLPSTVDGTVDEDKTLLVNEEGMLNSHTPDGDLVPETPPDMVAEPVATPEPLAKGGYISSARRAAIDAAAQQFRPVRRRNGRKVTILLRWALAASVVLFVVTAVLVARQVMATAAARADTPAAHLAVSNARFTLEQRARAGERDAELALGLKLMNGTGTPVNVEQGVAWLERAAAAGQPVAQNLLGVLYQTGTGVRVDMKRAVRWYEAAARAGNVKAMTNLGKVFAGGWDEGTDYSAAARWFSAAAAYGDVDAEFDLAVLYERGQGISRDIMEACRWYMLAGAQGDANAAQRANILSARLDPSEVRAIHTTAAAFKPQQMNLAANAPPKAAE